MTPPLLTQREHEDVVRATRERLAALARCVHPDEARDVHAVLGSPDAMAGLVVQVSAMVAADLAGCR